MDCAHDQLQVTVSPHAREAGFTPVPPERRAAAAVRTGRVAKQSGPVKSAGPTRDALVPTAPVSFPYCYPAPLVLPGDALAHDPKEPPQSLLSWIQLKERNAMTSERKTVYLARPPIVTDEVAIMREWITPLAQKGHGGRGGRGRHNRPLEPPTADHVREYLEAFYHGLPVRSLPETFKFTSWDGKAARKAAPAHVGLAIGESCTRVRTRPCPTRTFARQLCLGDMLDALIEVVPDDAHSILLLLDHDLYEDEEDDFCCGRAYGGSRVAVVSSARYHPDLDEEEGIDRDHMWPASHCASYVGKMCSENDDEEELPDASDSWDGPMGDGAGPENQGPFAAVDDARHEPLETTPLGIAVRKARDASKALQQGSEARHHHPWVSPCQSANSYGLWLSRVARTASHELGHCFALGHCVYYACVMQSTSGIIEDGRQPPYLCHICLKKVTRAVLDVNPYLTEEEYVARRDMALSHFCKKWERVPMFAGYQGWLDAMGTWRRQVLLCQAEDSRCYESYPTKLYGTV